MVVVMDNLITNPAEIVDAEKMTPGQARYWHCVARNEALRVNIVDPRRLPLRTLRSRYPAGTVVYRASTGGKWGKSAQIVTL